MCNTTEYSYCHENSEGALKASTEELNDPPDKVY